jgi:hypothetical protein
MCKAVDTVANFYNASVTCNTAHNACVHIWRQVEKSEASVRRDRSQVGGFKLCSFSCSLAVSIRMVERCVCVLLLSDTLSVAPLQCVSMLTVMRSSQQAACALTCEEP